MKKNKVLFMFIAGLVVVAVVIIAQISLNSLKGVIALRGYEFSVPESYSLCDDGSIKNKKGEEIGKLLAVDEAFDIENAQNYSGVLPNGEIEKEEFSEKVIKNTFNSDKGKVFQYFVYGLPNPDPYALSLVLYKSDVREGLADKIAKTLKIPEIGENPPPKNVFPITYGMIEADKVYKTTLLDGSIMVKNIHLLDEFTKFCNDKKDAGVEILEYVQSENGIMEIKKWCYLESSSKNGYVYSYYNKDGSVYTYDNNPVVFSGIKREVYEDKGLTSYNISLAEEMHQSVLDIPLNIYREYADELLAMKSGESDNESIYKILEKIMTKEQLECVKAQKEGTELKLTFSKTELLDRGKLPKDVVVLFSLILDVEKITVSDDAKNTYVFYRKEMLNSVNGSSKNRDDFVKLTEEIENIAPAEPEKEKSNDGEVVYSGTVLIARGSKVTHPRTGKKVLVDPYAEKYGVSHYLGKPITCTIKRKGSGYIATAVCGGSVIASNELANEEELNRMIGMIESY